MGCGNTSMPQIELEFTHKLAANCMLILSGRWESMSLSSHAGKRRVEGKNGLAATPIE